MAVPSKAAVNSAQARWVTLVTGDRILVEPAGTTLKIITGVGGKGRPGIQLVRRVENGDTFVIPTDALALVASHRVDQRLFDVSELLRSGYDDRSRADLPLIVTYSGTPATAAARTRVGDGGARVTRSLPAVGGDAVTVPKANVAGFWTTVTGGAARPALAGGLSRVWLDGRVQATLDHSVPQIGAPTAWKAGYTGKGVNVAVLDTGIDTDHPDLADAVSAAEDFTGSASGTDDRYGHGTHVAGIITGTGKGSGGKYVGVAPDAKLLNGKVLNDYGLGSDSGVLAGMQWAVAQGARVVNMSLGDRAAGDGNDPVSVAVNQLTAQSGALFVVAAGNTGPDGTVGAPASADAALTVGAVDRNDELAAFSTRGPRSGDQAIKPDITGPGVDIVSALAGDSHIADAYPAVDGRYVSLSGTSMAAPHVAGAEAILAGEHPDWRAAQLKAAMMGAAKATPKVGVYEQGAGRVDVARAVAQPVYTTPASVSDGTMAWPHDDDKPIRKTVTYHNDGDAALTLSLATEMNDPQGDPAPAGMFTLDKPTLTVPAHGTADVDVIADTRVDGPDGSYGGALVATGGNTTVRTPVGVTREVESYDLTVRALDRTGAPTSDYFLRLVDIDHNRQLSPDDGSPNVVMRVPKGHYYLEAEVHMPDDSSSQGYSTSFEVEPDYVVNATGTLVIDAREAKPTGTRYDRPEARTALANVGFHRTVAGGATGMELITDELENTYVRPSDTSAPTGQFSYVLSEVAGKPDGAGTYTDTPYVYSITWQQDGRVPTDLVRAVHDPDLVRVEDRIAASAPDQSAWLGSFGPLRTPGRVVEYDTPGEHRWSLFLLPKGKDLADYGYDIELTSAAVTLRPGQPLVRQWNRAVFGPSFPADQFVEPIAVREGDFISAGPPLFGDQSTDHAGYSAVDSSHLTLSRDGHIIGESPDQGGSFRVPADNGRYQLRVEAERSVSTLSTKEDIVWTFASGHVDEAVLPMMAVRFAPELDEFNRAAGGRPFAFPVSVQRQPGATYGKLITLTVEVSGDDGRTWRPASVTGDGLSRNVRLDNPVGPGYVSLRATATDDAGNAVTETLIRAYAIQG